MIPLFVLAEIQMPQLLLGSQFLPLLVVLAAVFLGMGSLPMCVAEVQLIESLYTDMVTSLCDTAHQSLFAYNPQESSLHAINRGKPSLNSAAIILPT